MGLINKIREKSGLAVGIIALGLGLFVVGGDLLAPNSMILGSNKMIVGEIAGVEIQYQEYINEIEEQKNTFLINFNRNPSEGEMYTVREQAWLNLINKYVFKKEFERLGINVTDEEIVDMVQGKNISPELRELATNPETGEFDRSFILAYLQNIATLPPDAQYAWYQFEKNLGPGRLRLKYDNLILNSFFPTQEDARREHILQNTIADIDFLYFPYYTVSDSLVKVTDAQLQDYLKKNAARYKTEESRSLDYVSFSLVPSARDSAIYMEDIERLKEEFFTVEDDSTFARLNSDGPNSFGTFIDGQLPPSLERLGELVEGGVYGPFIENGYYEILKLSSIEETGNYSARASHILFRAQADADKAEARRKATDVLNQLKGGADFEAMAREYSDDNSSVRGGDLGWFNEGDMVTPFNDAVFGASKEGLIPNLVESEFGFHIIKVTKAKTRKKYKIASIQLDVVPSDETRDNAYRNAGSFAANVRNYDEFKSQAAANNLQIFEAFEVQAGDRSLSTLFNAREIVRWLFNDAKVGSVSQVFELDEQYVVAVMTGKVDAGTLPLNLVRNDVENRVKNEMKAQIIKDRVSKLSGSLADIAAGYGYDVRVENNPSLPMSSNAIGIYGLAPRAIGKAFALSNGGRTEPVAEDNGVFMIEVKSIMQAPEINELSIYKDQLRARYPQRAAMAISEAIKEYAEIKDYRYRFF
jgi:peptidyl-prolyl cis-trans isomerase D